MVLDISKVHVQLRRAAAQKGKEITLPFAAIPLHGRLHWGVTHPAVQGEPPTPHTRTPHMPANECSGPMLVCQTSFITTYGQLSEGGPASFEPFVFRKNSEWYQR